MRAVFLDRDGTIIKDMVYLSDPERLRFLKGSIEGLKALTRAGYLLFIVTNQSGVSRGYLSLDRLHRIHRLMDQYLRREGIQIKEYAYCPHHPNERCRCRKPETFMIRRILKNYPEINLSRSFMVGDKITDVELGKRMGMKTILITDNTDNSGIADFTARNLEEAAKIILREG